MLHEEEFFDAIDATLDKWDKEEEKVLHIINYCMAGAIGGSGGPWTPIILFEGPQCICPPPPIFGSWISYFSPKLSARNVVFSMYLHCKVYLYHFLELLWLNAIMSVCSVPLSKLYHTPQSTMHNMSWYLYGLGTHRQRNGEGTELGISATWH